MAKMTYFMLRVLKLFVMLKYKKEEFHRAGIKEEVVSCVCVPACPVG